MERLTTTEMTSLLNVTPQRVNILVQQAEIPESDLSRKGLKKVFSPKAARALLAKRGVNYNQRKTFAFTNNKGGVGKTTCTVNIGSMAANLGMKVLIIDNDPQANATSYLLSRENKTSNYCLHDVVLGKAEISDVIVKVDDNLDILPSNLSNNHLESFFQSRNFNASTYYKKLLAALDYNLIIWDLSPSLSTSNTFALMSCDEIFAVTDLSEFGYQGVEMTINSILEMGDQYEDFKPVIQILINQFDERKLRSLEYISKLQELAPINPTIIKTDSAVSVAQMQKMALPQKSKSYTEYLEIVSKIVGLPEKNTANIQ
jgi:chromosome partitioning protein